VLQRPSGSLYGGPRATSGVGSFVFNLGFQVTALSGRGGVQIVKVPSYIGVLLASVRQSFVGCTGPDRLLHLGIHRVNVLLLIMGYMGEENPSLSNRYIIRLAGVFSLVLVNFRTILILCVHIMLRLTDNVEYTIFCIKGVNHAFSNS